MRRHARRWRTVLLALLAVGFLLAMVLTGKLPETRQLVKFEARGVLAVPPEQVRRVDLHVGEHTITFVRLSDHAWVGGKGQEPISGELQEHLEQAIAFMHTSRPVRVMHRDEYHSTPLTGVGYPSLGRFFGLNRHQSRCVGALLNTCSARDYATMSAVAPPARVRSRAYADGAATSVASQGDNFFFIALSRSLTCCLPIEFQRFLQGNTQRFFEVLFGVLLTIDTWNLSNPANPPRP